MEWLDLLRQSMRQSMKNKLIFKMLFVALGYLSGIAIVIYVPDTEWARILIGLCIAVAVCIYEDISSKYFKDEV